VEITKETVREMLHGWTTVGTSPVPITPLQLIPYKGILLFAPGTAYPGGGNSAPIWVGGPRVTADQNEGTGGTPIVPGSSLFVPLDKPDIIYVVSNAVTQKLSWMVV